MTQRSDVPCFSRTDVFLTEADSLCLHKKEQKTTQRNKEEADN